MKHRIACQHRCTSALARCAEQEEGLRYISLISTSWNAAQALRSRQVYRAHEKTWKEQILHRQTFEGGVAVTGESIFSISLQLGSSYIKLVCCKLELIYLVLMYILRVKIHGRELQSPQEILIILHSISE